MFFIKIIESLTNKNLFYSYESDNLSIFIKEFEWHFIMNYESSELIFCNVEFWIDNLEVLIYIRFSILKFVA